MSEYFAPLPHVSPDTPVRRMLFVLRRLADFQVRTVYRDVRKFFASIGEGTVASGLKVIITIGL